MQKITATELARNPRAVLDRVMETGEEYVVEHSKRAIARVSPAPGHQTAAQALADLYRTLPDKVTEGWLEDAARGNESLSNELRDPWAS